MDAQKTVTRKELTEMRIGETRVFWLEGLTKLQSVASTCTQLKNEQKGEWRVNKDYKACAVSVTRLG